MLARNMIGNRVLQHILMLSELMSLVLLLEEFASNANTAHVEMHCNAEVAALKNMPRVGVLGVWDYLISIYFHLFSLIIMYLRPRVSMSLREGLLALKNMPRVGILGVWD